MQHQLREIRKQMDLEGSQMHRTLWALWLTQWQGVLRGGDLIRGDKDQLHAWDASRDTHRGRVELGIGRDVDGNVLGAKISTHIKPTKPDQLNERQIVRSFVVDGTPGALSAGLAIYDMLKRDMIEARLEDIPLFRNPGTKREVTYKESQEGFYKFLETAGYGGANIKLHSLRIGGATAYSNVQGGGELLATYMGSQKSEARCLYIGT